MLKAGRATSEPTGGASPPHSSGRRQCSRWLAALENQIDNLKTLVSTSGLQADRRSWSSPMCPLPRAAETCDRSRASLSGQTK